MTKHELMTARDLAERYGFHPQTIYNLVNQRRIPFVKIGAALRFDPDEIEAWERHTEPIRVNPI